MSEKRITNTIIQSAYLIAMYTGIRAIANRVRSAFLPVPRAAVLNRTIIPLSQSASVNVRVHARNPPRNISGAEAAGMISVFLVSASIPRILYSLLRVSSHFGDGHIELAFYETQSGVHVFAVRNILRSNLQRLGFVASPRKLSVWTERNEVDVLNKVLEELRSRNLNAGLVSPEECVELAVSPRLLKPQTRDRAIAVLTRKYERMARQVQASVFG